MLRGMPQPEPLRILDDGTPCWCVDPQTSHAPKCQTLRAFAGTKGQPTWLDGRGARSGSRAHSARLKDAFIAEYSNVGIVRSACEVAGITRETYDVWRKNDPDFAQRLERARDEATDRMEREALRRGVEGTDKPVYQGGLEVGVIREYSDQLLTLMLKANRPTRFRENIRQEVTGADGGAIVHSVLPAMEDHERQLLRKVLEEAIKAQEALTTPVSGNVG